MTKKLVLLFCILIAASSAGFAQDVSYPFKVECSESLLMAGQTTKFTSKFTFTTPTAEHTYNWTVSDGAIVSGQGTPTIEVQLPKEGGHVTATVQLDIVGAMWPGQQTTDTCTVQLVQAPKPEMVSQLSANWNCEEGLAVMDNFYIGLSNNPVTQGYVINFAKRSDKKSVLRHQRFLQNSVRFRKFDPSRITFLTAVSDDPRTEFWLVPPGAEAPAAGPSDFDPVKRETKPYVFGLESSDGVAGCEETPYDPVAYADHLKGSKDRGKIVISERSLARFRRKEREVRNTLQKAGVAQSRVRSQFVKVSHPLQGSVELWIIPK